MADVVTAGIQKIGSVGTIVGASMESAGHHTQSLLLDQLGGGSLGAHLGGLIYLIAIIGALITLASGGSYRYSLWLLVGPPLFFFLVGVRSPSSGAEWKFGDRVHSEDQVKKGTRGLVDGDGSAGEVSTFFKGWNMLTSGTIQGFIELLDLTEKGSDLDFMNKTDRYIQTFNSTSLDPRLTGFVNMTLVNRCAGYFYLKKWVADPAVAEIHKEGARKVLEEHGNRNSQVSLRKDPWLQNWLAEVFKNKMPPQVTKEVLTCDDLWALGVTAFKELQAPGIIDMLTKMNLPDGLTQDQAKEKLLWKFGMQVGNGDTVSKELGFGGGIDDVRLSLAINELSARMIFKELSKVDPNLALLELEEHPQLAQEGGYQFDEGTSRALRKLHNTEEYQYKGELIIGALTLPYIQGCILYFLAVTFPFFALMVLLPGRHTAILFWMGLWLWAKLWDLGFAVVMVIDNMLYALMPHGPPITEAELNDPGLAFKALLEVDPTYSVTTYYNLLACCLLGVPIITGMLVHRGGHEVMSAVSSSFRTFPSKYGTSMAAYKRALMAQHSLKKARLNEFNESSGNLWAVTMADGRIKRAFNDRSQLSALKQAGSAARAAVDRVPMPGAIKAMAKIGTAVGEKALDAYIEHSSGIADTQHLVSQQTLAYNESKSTYNMEMAAEAVLDRYNSHHFVRDFMWRSMVDAENAKHYLPLGGAANDAVSKMYNFAKGVYDSNGGSLVAPK